MSQKLIFSTTTQTTYPTQPQPLTTTGQIAQHHFSKPQKDLYKALREQGVDPSLFSTLTLPPPSEPLQLQITSAENQGRRPQMEDASFHCQTPEGFLMGLFDGHGDRGSIAKKAADTFKTSFSTTAQKYPDDFKKTFKEISTLIHTSITDKMGGTTALVCYFNSTSHQLHISNLGDGKAMLFRKKESTILECDKVSKSHSNLPISPNEQSAESTPTSTGNSVPKLRWDNWNGIGTVSPSLPLPSTIQCFPISIHRDWASPKDIERVKNIFDAQTFDRWIKEPDAKRRRFPLPLMGVNTSRSMGDNSMQFNGKSAVSHTPRVTCIQCKEGDLLVMGCDGLWDFVSSQELLDTCISPFWDSPNLAQIIVNHALKMSQDNITVICAHAKTDLSDSNDLDLTQPYDDSDSGE